MEPIHEYLTLDEVATLLRRCKETIRRKVRGGELSALDIGGEYLFTPEDIQAFLDRSKTTSNK